jgi:hypothetical protein
MQKCEGNVHYFYLIKFGEILNLAKRNLERVDMNGTKLVLLIVSIQGN